MTDKVKEQISLSDKLVWFSRADLSHSQGPIYIYICLSLTQFPLV